MKHALLLGIIIGTMLTFEYYYIPKFNLKLQAATTVPQVLLITHQALWVLKMCTGVVGICVGAIAYDLIKGNLK